MSEISISVIVDNHRSEDFLQTEHGLCLWIETSKSKILFDLGQSDKFALNAEAMGIDIKNADSLIISHGHYDHTGRLDILAETGFNGNIYIHPSAAQQRFSANHEKIRDISMPSVSIKALDNFARNGKVIWTEHPTAVCENIIVTSSIPRTNNFEDVGGKFFLDSACTLADDIIDDQSLIISTSKGLVILLGCAHSGLVNTIDYASKITSQDRIYAVIGGFHLVNASDNRLAKTIAALKRYDIKLLAPGHCTGEKATAALKDEFGDSYIPFSSGTAITI